MATDTHSHFIPSTVEEMQQFLGELTDDELREIYDTTKQLEDRIATYGPQTDDELHSCILHELGIDIPRVAVCEDHDPPFNFLADLFFERVDAALLMANRGGAKTYSVAILHWMNSRFKPGCSSLTFGAVANQSNRAYAHLRRWIYDEDGEKKPFITSSLMSETLFRNGSVVEIVGSTPEQVNGPHPHKAHADEIELMRDDTWRESRNLTVAGKTRDGHTILPQDIMTSTRKGPSGRMQELIDEIDEALAEGFEPPRTLYKYCIKETAAERPDCQMVSAEAREERLKELKQDPCSLCDCNRIRKGKWSDGPLAGQARTLNHVCNGDFFRSRGWQPPAEINKQFRENDKDTFEVQQLCVKAELKFHYFGSYNDAHHSIRNFVLDPENGPIFTSTDWGGCYDGETEVLTARGWVKWPEVRDDDEFASLDLSSRKVVFQKAEAIMRKEYGGVMEHYENRSVDLLVSADHNMLVAPIKGSGPSWRIVRSDSIGERGDGLRVTRTSEGRVSASYAPFVLPGVTRADGKVFPDLSIDPEDWAAFMGFWMAEGHTHLGKNNEGDRRISGEVGLTHYNRENIEAFKRIAGRYFNVGDTINWAGRCGQLKINDPRLYTYLAQFGKAGDKYLPDDLKNWDGHLLGIYLSWHMLGDGHVDNDGDRDHSKRIFTGSKRLADDLQEIAMYAGSAAVISVRPPRDSEIDGRTIKASLNQYVVSFIEKRLTPQIAAKRIQPPVKTEISPDEWNMGMVYCAHLPEHHTLYVRRNGKPVWSGNTNPHSVHWYQLLTVEIEADGWTLLADGTYPRVRVKEGTIVCFDEIYIAEVGNDKLGDMVIARENGYRQKNPTFRVTERFADPQGKAARIDWKDKGLRCTWHVTREFDEHIKAINSYVVDDDLFRIVGENCPQWRREVKGWRKDEETLKQIDEDNHCVTGDTLVQTREGLRLAEEIDDGEIVDVLTQGGEYRPAEWKHYGAREVYEVEFDNGETIRTTDLHEWVVQRNGKGHKGTGQERVVTLDLKGRRVPTQAANWEILNIFAYNEGVRNGLVYGDGTTFTNRQGIKHGVMRQYGEENCSILERFFRGHGKRVPSPHLDVKVATGQVAVALKDLPTVDDPDYTRGFIAGLIAADGAVNKQGCCYISSSKRDDIDKIVTLCRTVGVVVSTVEEREPALSNYPNATTQFRIWITKGSLDETLLLKPSHRVNGLKQTKWNCAYTRLVVRVERAGVAPVFCCEEPETNTWVTGTGILTSNSMSDFRYAVANIKKLRKKYRKIKDNQLPGSVGQGRAAPRVTVTTLRRPDDNAPVGLRDKGDAFGTWRRGLGEPVSPFDNRRR